MRISRCDKKNTSINFAEFDVFFHIIFEATTFVVSPFPIFIINYL